MSVTITTNSASNIIKDSAVLNGSISGLITGDVYNAWFEYSELFFSMQENFEEWLSGDTLVDWDIPSGTDYYKEDDIVQDGLYALKIIPDSFTKITHELVSDIIPYRNKTIIYSAWIGSSVDNDASFELDINGTPIVSHNNGSVLEEWVEISGNITIPNDATGALNINLCCGENIQSGTHSVYDNIKIFIVDTITETSTSSVTEDSNFEALITNLLSHRDYWFRAVVEEDVSLSTEQYGNIETFTSSFFSKFSTDLRTKIIEFLKYLTNLIVNIRIFKKYTTKLYTKLLSTYKLLTDLRLRLTDYTLIQPGKVTDTIVYLDGIELTDIDYTTLRVNYRKNSSPSNATFALSRYHDKLNYKMNGTFSEITNENKVEIYDGSIKLFTGYITQLNTDSETETVSVTAEDCRYKIAKESIELWYGGDFLDEDPDEEAEEKIYNYAYYSKTVAEAIAEVMSSISSLISGYDEITFGTQFVPEYVKSYNDCASFLTELVTNSANADWYVDANERIRFCKVGRGDIKTLQLSSINDKRHLYDVIIDNTVINKKTDYYYRSYNVELGKHIVRKWNRQYYEYASDVPDEAYDLNESTDFRFQKYLTQPQRYVGSGVTVYSYYVPGQGWLLKSSIVMQYLSEDTEEDLDSINVGVLEPKKTLYLTDYGKKETNIVWEEKTKQELLEMGYTNNAEWFADAANSDIFLAKIQEEQYDYTDFAEDGANFELSQNNVLTTTATITLLLKAFEYYNIELNSRINLDNTIESNIYKNNNGFPLNVDSISIDLSTRIVTLNLTNYGKEYYERVGNYIKNYTPNTVIAVEKRYPVISQS